MRKQCFTSLCYVRTLDRWTDYYWLAVFVLCTHIGPLDELLCVRKMKKNIDLQVAFDRIWIEGIIYQLHEAGLRGCRIIKSNRTHFEENDHLIFYEYLPCLHVSVCC